MKQSPRQRESNTSEVRDLIRNNEYGGATSGIAPGFVQANLVVLPGEYAFDFLKFCVRNPKPCPILEVTEAGDPEPLVTAPGADLRTDVPRYRLYENGELVDEPQSIEHLWKDDLVAFLTGCSFTFETALLAAGLRVAHVDQGRNVPMYVTGRDCVSSGPFAGSMVVSMRPYRADEIPLVVSVSGRYPSMHGAPVHVGDPDALGISELANPEFGDAVEIAEDQMPVFWACGVTPQAVAMKARPPMMITHSPGHMFITDRVHSEYEM
ncbi:MAG: putative hydro-lyase [Rubrobacteraceae bacterium]